MSPFELTSLPPASRISATRELVTRPGAAVGAAIFAMAVLLTPWESFGGSHYADFNVYLEIFRPGSQSVREMYKPQSLLDSFTHEVLWDEFVRLLTRICGTPFFALKSISAAVLWINAFVLYRRYGYLLPTLLLLNPLFLVFALSQLRLAFAIALLLIAICVRYKSLQGCLLVASVFVHSAAPIFIGLYIAAKYVEKFGQDWSLQRLMLYIGFVCSVLIFILAFGRDALLFAIGDRRAYFYTGAYGSVSLLYASFWPGLVSMQFLAGREYIRRPDNIFSVMILILFVGLTLLNTYGSRFIAAAFPIVIASTLNLPPESRHIVLPTFLIFQIVQFLYWFGIHFVT